ncbi:hypothetical protein ACWCQM_11615 [Streptomyces sp. NPDC002125]
MTAQMTPDRLAEIRERLASTLKPQKTEISELLDEIDALHDDVNGTCLARWEEEQENEQLRLSIAGLHARITELEAAQATTIAERDAQIIAWLEKKAREEGSSNKDRRNRADVLFRMADKLSRGAVRPPLSRGPDPLVVNRFDVAMEPAPEEEQVLTVGCIDENGNPVALLLDMEARSKVARWLAPELNDTGRATTT